MMTLNSFTFNLIVGFFSLITLVGIVFAVMSVCDLLFTSCPRKWRQRSVAILCGLAGMLPFWIVETIGKQQALVNGSEIAHDFSQNTIMWQWKWDSLTTGKNVHLAWYGEKWANVTMGVHPITENPKVRSFRYVVAVKTRETVPDLLLLEKSTGVIVFGFAPLPGVKPPVFLPFERAVKSLLYD